MTDERPLKSAQKRAWPVGFWNEFWKDGPAGVDFVAPEPLPDAPHRDAVLEEMHPRDSS